MRVPVFRAKDLDSDDFVEGFYCEYPVTTGSMPGTENSSTTPSVIQSNIAHCIFTYKPGMMGLINEPVGCTIDLTTLEFVKFIEIPCKTPKIII